MTAPVDRLLWISASKQTKLNLFIQYVFSLETVFFCRLNLSIFVVLITSSQISCTAERKHAKSLFISQLMITLSHNWKIIIASGQLWETLTDYNLIHVTVTDYLQQPCLIWAKERPRWATNNNFLRDSECVSPGGAWWLRTQNSPLSPIQISVAFLDFSRRLYTKTYNRFNFGFNSYLFHKWKRIPSIFIKRFS